MSIIVILSVIRLIMVSFKKELGKNVDMFDIVFWVDDTAVGWIREFNEKSKKLDCNVWKLE
jgi:hypothetical protein